jgi:SAM-dependent methyltransferase
MNSITTDEKIKEAVRETYGSLARRFVEEPVSGSSERPRQTSCCGPSQATSCCGPSEAAVELTDTAATLYSSEELAGLPESVTGASAGCGNPLAIAELRPGQTVLDLGSGGGIDCFLAAKQVGPEGKVIGLDMTPEMIRLARRNAKTLGAKNVEFRFGEMEEMPLPDGSVDVIISNCVINLSPEKDAVFGEAYRVLRPGGRLSVSDMVVSGALPQSIRDRLDAWVGCIAGALEESDYLSKIRAAGFDKVEVVSRDYASAEGVLDAEDVQVLAVGPAVPGDRGSAPSLLTQAGLSPGDLTQLVASIKVRAVKPV